MGHLTHFTKIYINMYTSKQYIKKNESSMVY